MKKTRRNSHGFVEAHCGMAGLPMATPFSWDLPHLGTSGGVVWGWSFQGDAMRCQGLVSSSILLSSCSGAAWRFGNGQPFHFFGPVSCWDAFFEDFFTWPNLLGKHNHAPMFCLSKTEGSINNSICMAEAWTKQDQALKLAGEPNQWISIPTIDGLVCPERC